MIESCRVVASGNAAQDHALQAGTCLGEIDALNWIAPAVASESIRSCVPPSITPQQMATVIVDYLDKNADRIREPFQGLALEALAGTWPCAKRIGWFEKLWKSIGANE
jgi:hypothetical protein